MNIALWEKLDFYTKKLDIERNKAVRNQFQFVGNSCEKDSWAYLFSHSDAASATSFSSGIGYGEEKDVINEVSEVFDDVDVAVSNDDGDDNDSEYELPGKAKISNRIQRSAPSPKPTANRGSSNQKSGGGRISCPTCGKMFKTMGELKQHEPFHTRVRSFVCAICQKSFLYASSYYAHKRRHTTPPSRQSRPTSTSPANASSSTSPPHSTTKRPRGSEIVSP